MTDNPLWVFCASFFLLWVANWAGKTIRRLHPLDPESQEDFGVTVAAALTLLGLIIGFTFAMAITRYDQRKTYEEAEANAIGTEYTRLDLISAPEAAQTRKLLKQYLDQRVAFYTIRGEMDLQRARDEIAHAQTELWSTVRGPALAQPTPLTALVLSGMNDVFDAQGYMQAAWWNRIPLAAWLLLSLVAIVCNLMLGFSARQLHPRRLTSVFLPLILSLAFFLISDIDSPRGGIIHVPPQNLINLQHSLSAGPTGKPNFLS